MRRFALAATFSSGVLIGSLLGSRGGAALPRSDAEPRGMLPPMVEEAAAAVPEAAAAMPEQQARPAAREARRVAV